MGERMSTKALLSAFGVMLFTVSSAAAQEKPGTLAALEFQKPKNGMVRQYEDGRKQKAAWHRRQKDPQPLLVWQILSGDSTGSYIVGRVRKHWSDFDKPAVSTQAELEEFQKVVGNYTDSIVARFYNSLPEISNPDVPGRPPQLDEVITFRVRYGKESDFRSAVSRVYDAVQKTNWSVHYEWYVLHSGGDLGTYVLFLPRADWADFEGEVDVNPFRKMLTDAFGKADADSIIDRIDTSVQSETSEIIQFRSDLSDLPNK